MSKDLLRVEKKHPQRQSAFKIAFLYAQGQEQTLQNFFDHRNGSEAFWEFVNTLGKEILLKGWKKYRGDIGVGSDAASDAKSYYTEWRGTEVMFHMCCWMNAEQHRRLIGNDVVFVIFNDSENPFNPAPLDSLGTVPQVFIVVQSHMYQNRQGYRLGVFTRPNIKAYEPLVPSNFWIPKEELKDFLFTKVYNGYITALACPPMNRLFEVPRADTITTIAKKYPKETIKDIKAWEKSAKAARKNLKELESQNPSISVTVYCATNTSQHTSQPSPVSSHVASVLPASQTHIVASNSEDNTLNNPDLSVVVKIAEQKLQTASSGGPGHDNSPRRRRSWRKSCVFLAVKVIL